MTTIAESPEQAAPSGAVDEVLALLAQAEAHLAAKELSPALALAESLWPRLQHAAAPLRRRAGLVLATARYRSGRLGPMLELALELLPLMRAALDEAGAPALRQAAARELIDQLRLAAMAGADTSRFEPALACAREAHQRALELEDDARISLSLNALACCLERSGDPWQAVRLMQESLAIARRQAEPYPVFVNLNNLAAALVGQYYMLRDGVSVSEARATLHEALPHLREAVAMSEAFGEPFFRAMPRANLGEVLIHLGQGEEAEGHLREASLLAEQHGFQSQLWRVRASYGELALLRGETDRARACLNEVLAHPGTEAQPILHLRLHHALWRTATASGETPQALVHLEAYLRLERARSLAQLRAQSELFVTRMEVEQLHQEGQRQRQRAVLAEAQTRVDPLTGLGNRRALAERWPAWVEAACTSGAPMSLAMLDLDHFKLINDAHGHAVGDRVLVELAQLLRQHLRSAHDGVIRMGGEEFLLVLPEADAPRALEVCQRLGQAVAGHDWGRLAPGLAVTASIGVASAAARELDASPDTLAARADGALYRAKAQGRNGVVLA